MRNVLACVAVVVAGCGMEASEESSSLATLDAGVSANATRCVFNTRLLPENEVRMEPITDPVDSTASGHAQVKIRADGTLEYKVFILNRDEETFVAGHVHSGAADANGPVVVPLFLGPPTSDNHFVQHASTPIAAELADEICSTPSAFYVNYHTAQDPQGAVRGQLR
jgi:hypothetical protein